MLKSKQFLLLTQGLSFRTTKTKTLGACLSKVPKLFELISGDIILFVSSKRRRLEARNFAIIFFLFPLQHMKRSALQNKQVVILRMSFRARKVLRTFEKRAPSLRFRTTKTKTPGLIISFRTTKTKTPGLRFRTTKTKTLY